MTNDDMYNGRINCIYVHLEISSFNDPILFVFNCFLVLHTQYTHIGWGDLCWLAQSDVREIEKAMWILDAWQWTWSFGESKAFVGAKHYLFVSFAGMSPHYKIDYILITKGKYIKFLGHIKFKLNWQWVSFCRLY